MSPDPGDGRPASGTYGGDVAPIPLPASPPDVPRPGWYDW